VGTPAQDEANEPHRTYRTPPAGLIAAVGVLLAIPVVALVWVSSYAKPTPELWGFPFFYWYQFLWVFLAAICTSLAYRLLAGYLRRDGDDR
jgi:membrane protein implicated in regulation of membrane protease activity